MDITTIPQGAFLKYVYEKFDIDNPTEPDSAMRLEQWKRRHPTSALNGASATTGTSAATTPPSVTPPKKKKGTMKPSTTNYPPLKQDAEYFGWIGKVKAISKAESTANV